MWKAWAILKLEKKDNDLRWYAAISDIWDVCCLGTEYISKKVIEAPENSEFFERVYGDDISWKLFRIAEQLRDIYNKAFK